MTKTISLRGPADLVGTLPFQLGYHPRRSLVVVALTGRRLGVVQRLDLPDEEHVAVAARQLLAAVVRNGHDRIIAVGYEDVPGESMPMLVAVREEATRAEVSLGESLVVRDGRWYAPFCDQSCCPDEGEPIQPDEVPAVAEFVAMEKAPVAERADLDRLVRPERPLLRAAVGSALARMPFDVDLVDDWADGVGDLTEQVAGVWAMALDTGPARPPIEGLDADELALLFGSLVDRRWRDSIVAWICPGQLSLAVVDEDAGACLDALLGDEVDLRGAAADDGHGAGHGAGPGGGSDVDALLIAQSRLRDRLLHLCRLAPDVVAPGMLTVTACLAWFHGDGAVAMVCLERALAIDPGYRLAGLVEQAVSLGVHPRGWGSGRQASTTRNDSGSGLRRAV